MNPSPIKYDVVVVGAGPAGSVAARCAASHGVKVLLIDKKKRLGDRPHCGEFIPQKLLTEFDISSRIIDQHVDYMETLVLDETWEPAVNNCGSILRSPDDSSKWGIPDHAKPNQFQPVYYPEKFSTPSSGCMIDRQAFDLGLAKQAAAAGALVLSDAKLMRLNGDYCLVRHHNQEITVESKVLIGADGHNSLIARSMNLGVPDFLVGVQRQVPLTQELRKTIIFFHKAITYGYGWLFPKGSSANLGLGMFPTNHSRPTQLLDYFAGLFEKWDILKPGVFSRSKGLIPVSGIRNRLVWKNMALIGDAAGLTHPVTGAGVPQAMVSGQLAGQTAVEAIKSDNISLLANYETQVRQLYSGVINHAKAKRGLMMGMWNSRDMKSICNETWISFKGYRKRVRRN